MSKQISVIRHNRTIKIYHSIQKKVPINRDKYKL